MDAEKRQALEARGWKFGDAADFLELSDEEQEIMEMRIKVAISVRKRREKLQLSQKDLAGRLKTSQPRVAKIERAAPGVSFDQILRAYVVMGGRFVFKEALPATENKRKNAKRKGV